MYMQEIEIMR